MADLLVDDLQELHVHADQGSISTAYPLVNVRIVKWSVTLAAFECRSGPSVDGRPFG